MKLITDNINGIEGSFYEILIENGFFDQSLFGELILYIDRLNEMDLTKVERLEKGNMLWELGYKIQSSIGYNYSKNDLFEIKNIDEQKLVEIGQVLEYICKSFRENQQLDMDFIKEMT